MEDEDMEEGIQSVGTVSSTPSGVETPDVLDLRKLQRKEPVKQAERPLHQVLEQREENIAPGTLYGSSHTYVLGWGHEINQLLKGWICLKIKSRTEWMSPYNVRSWKPWMNVLAAKYEEAREEEKLRNQKEDLSDMVAENANKRKRKQEKEVKTKKKDFQF